MTSKLGQKCRSPDLLALLSERNMHSILAFSNSFLICGPKGEFETPHWFNFKYGDGPSDKISLSECDCFAW